jgi:hypothetical protein
MLQMVAKQLRQQTHRNLPGLCRERSPPWAIRCGQEQARLVEPRASSRIGHQHLPSPIKSDAELLSRQTVMPRTSPQATASVPGGPSNKHADSQSPAFASRLRSRTSIAGSQSSCVSLSRECGSDTSLPRTCAALRGRGLRGRTADARDTGPCDVQFGGSCVVGLYHRERNHQGLGNRLIESDGRAGSAIGRVTCRERLGGMLRFYHRAAA